MTNRCIALENAKRVVARWESYVVRAIMAGDRAREDYGNIRIVNARKRLKRLLRP
jgi:phage gp37-like protein